MLDAQLFVVWLTHLSLTSYISALITSSASESAEIDRPVSGLEPPTCPRAHAKTSLAAALPSDRPATPLPAGPSTVSGKVAHKQHRAFHAARAPAGPDRIRAILLMHRHANLEATFRRGGHQAGGRLINLREVNW
jgi:hypothetical protein